MKKFLLKTAVIILIICISINTITLAANNSCTLSLDANTTSIEAGKEVTVLLKVSNITGDGIVAFNANIEYDSNIFTCKSNADDEGTWKEQSFLEKNLMMTRSDLEASTDNQTVAKLVFKAQDNAQIGKTTIKVSNIEFVTDNSSFKIDDVSLDINIKEVSNTGENTDNGNKPEEGNKNEGTNNGSQQEESKNKGTDSGSQSGKYNANQASTTLPYAGVQPFLVLGIIISIILLTIFYYKYRRYKGV